MRKKTKEEVEAVRELAVAMGWFGSLAQLAQDHDLPTAARWFKRHKQ
jgi:hypothetical protein